MTSTTLTKKVSLLSFALGCLTVSSLSTQALDTLKRARSTGECKICNTLQAKYCGKEDVFQSCDKKCPKPADASKPDPIAKCRKVHDDTVKANAPTTPKPMTSKNCEKTLALIKMYNAEHKKNPMPQAEQDKILKECDKKEPVGANTVVAGSPDVRKAVEMTLEDIKRHNEKEIAAGRKPWSEETQQGMIEFARANPSSILKSPPPRPRTNPVLPADKPPTDLPPLTPQVEPEIMGMPAEVAREEQKPPRVQSQSARRLPPTTPSRAQAPEGPVTLPSPMQPPVSTSPAEAEEEPQPGSLAAQLRAQKLKKAQMKESTNPEAGKVVDTGTPPLPARVGSRTLPPLVTAPQAEAEATPSEAPSSDDNSIFAQIRRRKQLKGFTPEEEAQRKAAAEAKLQNNPKANQAASNPDDALIAALKKRSLAIRPEEENVNPNTNFEQDWND